MFILNPNMPPLPKPTPSCQVAPRTLGSKLQDKNKQQKWPRANLDWTALALSAWASPKLSGPSTPHRTSRPSPCLNRTEAMRWWSQELGNLHARVSIARVNMLLCCAITRYLHTTAAHATRLPPLPFSFFLPSSSFPSSYFFPGLQLLLLHCNSSFYTCSSCFCTTALVVVLGDGSGGSGCHHHCCSYKWTIKQNKRRKVTLCTHTKLTTGTNKTQNTMSPNARAKLKRTNNTLLYNSKQNN
jgi:hypothetical protein